MFYVKEANYKVRSYSISKGTEKSDYEIWIDKQPPLVILKVLPGEKNIPVREIEFRTYARIEAGDKIGAYLNTHKKEFPPLEKIMRSRKKITEGKMVKRKNFNAKEKVSKLEKISDEGKILATFE